MITNITQDLIGKTVDLELLEKILTDYSDWLNKYGYIDSDYYAEEPKAVDRYLDIK